MTDSLNIVLKLGSHSKMFNGHKVKTQNVLLIATFYVMGPV